MKLVALKGVLRFSVKSFLRENEKSTFEGVGKSGTDDELDCEQWALTIRPKIPGRISGNFHGQMVQSFSSVKDDKCSLGIFQSQIEK